MPGDNIFSALAQGAQGYGTPASRAEAKLRKASSDTELEKLNLRNESGVDEQELQLLRENNQRLLGENARRKTDDAFRAFNIDQDPRHFNDALKDPILANVYPDVLTVDKIDIANDTALIEKAGLDPNDFTDEVTGPKLSSRFVKFTRKDGTKEIVDMLQLQAATGYTKRMNNEELRELKLKADIKGNAESKPGLTTDMKNSNREGEILDRQSKGEAISNTDKSFLSLMRDKKQGNVSGQIDEAFRQEALMLESVGGTEGWDKLDLKDKTTRRKLAPYITRMERIGGLDLPSDSRKAIRQVGKLMSLAKPVKNLTDAETGLMDATIFNLGKYASGTVTPDKMRGLKAAAGYTAFQNELRKVLYGSVLTPGEIQKFNAAYGTLRQQFPEVMVQFGTMLSGLKSDIESTVELSNEYIAEYRLGGSVDEIDNLIDNIDAVLAQEVFDTSKIVDSAKNKRLQEIFRK